MKEPTRDDRIMRDLRAIIRAEFPQLTYLGKWLYVIQVTDGVTIDAVAARDGNATQTKTTEHLPDVVKCPIWPGVLGEQVVPKVGARCIVEFLNGDPSRYICTGGDPSNPPETSMLHGGGAAAARVGDHVTAAYLWVSAGAAPPPGRIMAVYAGTTAGFAAGTAAVLAANTSVPGSALLLPLTDGRITTGSARCEIG